jgi:hypothetical protein
MTTSRGVLIVALLLAAAPAAAQPADVRAAQERHAAVLACGGATDAERLWDCAGEFTARVAYDVRGEWTVFRKTGGRRCDHAGTTIDCDKIIHRRTREFFDVVGRAGAPGMTAAWMSEGFDTPGNLVFVEPAPYGSAPPPPTPGPGPVTPLPPPAVDLTAVLARLDALGASVAQLREAVDQIAADSAEAAYEAAQAAGRASEIKTQLEALPSTFSWPEYTGKVLSFPVTLRPQR